MTRKWILLVLLTAVSGVLIVFSVKANYTSIVTAQDLPDYYFPFFLNSNQPLASSSYYMITTDNAFLYELGCELGTRDRNTTGAQDSVSVLDFSYPICDADFGFGADLFVFDPVSLDEIEEAVRQFALGYYTCTGWDNKSNLVIGVGTNNKSNPVNDVGMNNKSTLCNTEEKAALHGAAWAEMVNSVNQWLIDEGIFHQVQAYGASDIEVGWNTPEWSRAWVNGYDQINQYPLLHFGDAAGCPSSESSTSTLCGLGWTMEDVWFVSWGADASLPLPLIYRTDGIQARQWAHLSRYSDSQHDAPMAFTGVFTQSQACETAQCDGTDNEPYQAYRQLSSELNKYPETAMTLAWKTDIRWIQSSELSIAAAFNDPEQSEQDASPNQEVIEQILIALDSPDLSPQMQSSLEEKLSMFEMIALQIVNSRRNPAVKENPLTISIE